MYKTLFSASETYTKLSKCALVQAKTPTNESIAEFAGILNETTASGEVVSLMRYLAEKHDFAKYIRGEGIEYLILFCGCKLILEHFQLSAIIDLRWDARNNVYECAPFGTTERGEKRGEKHNDRRNEKRGEKRGDKYGDKRGGKQDKRNRGKAGIRRIDPDDYPELRASKPIPAAVFEAISVAQPEYTPVKYDEGPIGDWSDA